MWRAHVPPTPHSTCSRTRAYHDPNVCEQLMSTFKDGKLKPGVYQIQNIVGQTYVDIREHTGELCCRPATLLEGKGLVGLCPPSTYHRSHSCLQWEILPLGPGYTIRRARMVLNHVSLSSTERCSIARTRQAQTVLHRAHRTGKREYRIRYYLPRALEIGDCLRRALSWARICSVN